MRGAGRWGEGADGKLVVVLEYTIGVSLKIFLTANAVGRCDPGGCEETSDVGDKILVLGVGSGWPLGCDGEVLCDGCSERNVGDAVEVGADNVPIWGVKDVIPLV
jgi:hypothetical protein